MVVVQGDGQEGNVLSIFSKRVNVLNPCMSSGGTFKIDFDLSEPFTYDMRRMNRPSREQRIERTINFSQHITSQLEV